VPSPFAEVEACRAAIEALVRSERVDVLLPMTDSTAQMVPELRQKLDSLLIAFPEAAQYELASDKHRLMDLAARQGLAVPRQVVIESPAVDARAALSRAAVDFPLIVKPARSVVRSGDRLEKTAVRLAHGPEDLSRILGECAAAYPILLQERIEGPGLGAFVLAKQGRVLAAFGHRRIREKPPTGGVSVYRESVALREDVRRYTERLVEALEWTGVAMVEFKEDAATGTPFLMEVNGRLWGSLQLAIDAGVDFPALLLRSALGEDLEPVTSYRIGVRSRWLFGDLDHLIWILRRSPSARADHPSLPGRMRALGRFLVPWRPGDHWEVMRLSDPAPFLREARRWWGGILRRLGWSTRAR
jgi:predicted ATP-grasp superfamily ATP-dependent carboligase